MQNRVNFVLWLIIIFIVIINVLQGLWLINGFQEQKKQYRNLLTSCLSEALTLYQLQKIDQNKTELSKLYVIANARGLNIQAIDTTRRQIMLKSSAKIFIDSISENLGYSQLIQIQNRDSFSIPVFKSLFNSVLRKNSIDTSYILNVQKDDLGKSSNSTQRINNFTPTRMHYLNDDKVYNVKTAGILVNPYSNRVIYAAFKPFPIFFIKKMFGMLFLSLALFVTVNLALLYVLKTFRQQKKINEIKNDFINNMTHELRTPVTIASSALDVLLNHQGLQDQQKTRRYLKTSKEELVYLDNLIEKILDLAIEDRQDKKLNYEVLNPKEIILTLVENHHLIQSKDISFHLDLEGLNKDICLDRLHFFNALNNIIDNAIKYGEGSAEIYISGFISSTELRLMIRDNGPGIAKEHYTAVFEPFYRIPTGDLHNVKGFGLGLSYVKKVIKKHRGSIEITSQIGQGSTFIISIPTNMKNGC